MSLLVRDDEEVSVLVPQWHILEKLSRPKAALEQAMNELSRRAAAYL